MKNNTIRIKTNGFDLTAPIIMRDGDDDQDMAVIDILDSVAWLVVGLSWTEDTWADALKEKSDEENSGGRCYAMSRAEASV